MDKLPQWLNDFVRSRQHTNEEREYERKIPGIDKYSGKRYDRVFGSTCVRSLWMSSLEISASNVPVYVRAIKKDELMNACYMVIWTWHWE